MPTAFVGAAPAAAVAEAGAPLEVALAEAEAVPFDDAHCTDVGRSVTPLVEQMF
jgi:hypothetical protein